MKNEVSETVFHNEEIIRRFNRAFDNILSGYILGKLVFDLSGKVSDFEIIDNNNLFLVLLGNEKLKLKGKKCSEVFPQYNDPHFNWLDIVTPIALKNSRTKFSFFAESLEKWFAVNLFCPEHGYFIAIIDDITRNKKSEIELRRKKEEIEILNEEFRKQNLELGNRNEVLANLNDIHMQVIRELRDSIKKTDEMHRKLLDTELTARTTIDSLSDIIILTDSEGLIIDCNEACLKRFKIAKEELIGKLLFSLFPPDVAKFRHDGFENVKKNKKRSIFHDVNGDAFFETIVTPYLDSHDQVTKIVVIARDIAERHKAQVELYESERKYRLLAENSDDVIWTIDITSKKCTYVSPSIFKLVGFTVDEIMRIDFNSVVSKTWNELITDIYRRIKAVEDGDTSQYVQTNLMVFTCKDGSIKNIETVSKLNTDNKGFVFEVQGVSRDVTKRIEIEEQLKKALLQAEESDRLKSAFLANMSHEIRTPMNGIIGFADLLSSAKLNPEKIAKYSEIININGKHLLSIINDIIDISKIESGQVTVNESKVNINFLLKELSSFFVNAKFRNQKVNVILNSTLSDSDSTIIADEVKIKQVLTNLVSNALKFTSEGSVEIFCKKVNQDNKWFLLFKVTDTGIGIAKSDQNLIFERFRQVDFTSERKYGGTGLGLPISKAYVELMGGKIWVDSDVGRGSKFYFLIPFKSAHPAEISMNESSASEFSNELDWSKKTILIAEDESTNFLYLNEILQFTKAKIIHVINGAEAVKSCKENKHIDLVLMDVKMPEMNGLEATKLIKSYRPNLPIIAQTAFALSDDLGKAIEAGCDDYISKPILKDYLIEKLLKFL